MGFGDAIKTVFGKYATFTGRARRSEFWYWYLFVAIIAIVIAIVDAAIGSPILGYLVDLALIVPQLAVGARRLHDTGRSGWWQLIGIIPLVGIIVLIVFWCQDSAMGDNQHGPSPKAALGHGAYPTA